MLPPEQFALRPLHRRHYGIAVIDPPWTFRTYSAAGKGKSAEQHYDCMSIDDIYSMPVVELHPTVRLFPKRWVCDYSSRHAGAEEERPPGPPVLSAKSIIRG
jgi:hypothetical protein